MKVRSGMGEVEGQAFQVEGQGMEVGDNICMRVWASWVRLEYEVLGQGWQCGGRFKRQGWVWVGRYGRGQCYSRSKRRILEVYRSRRFEIFVGGYLVGRQVLGLEGFLVFMRFGVYCVFVLYLDGGSRVMVEYRFYSQIDSSFNFSCILMCDVGQI